MKGFTALGGTALALVMGCPSPVAAQQPPAEAQAGGDSASPTGQSGATGATDTSLTDQPADSGSTGGIVVTGSSIRGVASAGSPTVGVGLEELREAGVSSATEVARLLPQVLNLGADESRSSFNGGAQDGAANSTAINGVNLRGVGPESTLLLVNGRRIAPGGVIKALYDLNVIPTNAIARLEVVTDGASAIYGADAVAGVVNIITRRKTDAIESYGRLGFGDDIDQFVASQTLSYNWDKGGFFAAYEHNERSNLSGRDREFGSQDRRSRGGSDARSLLASPGNILVGTTRYRIPAGNGIGVNPATITPVSAANPANVFDEGAAADLLPSQNRESFLANIYGELAPGFELWVEGFYTTRDFYLNAPPASGTITVPVTNAFYVAPAGVARQPLRLEYRFALENNDPASRGDEQNFQIATGFDVDVGSGFQVSAYTQVARNDGYQSRPNVINNAALAVALASSNPATAFNPFGDGSFNVTNNPGLVDIIAAERNQTARATNWDSSVKIDGPLFDLGSGSVRVAVGAEYHENKFDQVLEAFNVLASGAPTYTFVNNSRDFYSLYGELFVPLVGDGGPGLERLELSGAVRYDHYSDFGGTTNPKLGVIYSPGGGFNLRGTFGTSFRAPSLVDSAGQIYNIFIQVLTDPTAPGGSTRGIFQNGGNPDLTPEEAETWSGGIDWKPDYIPGLTASVNYYKITYTNRIDVVPGSALTNPFYAPYFQRRPADAAGSAAFSAFLQQFLTSPNLQSPVEPAANLNAFIDGRRQNLGSLKQDGIDVSLAYAFDTSFGAWRLGADVSKILNLTRAIAPGAPEVDVLDTFGNPVDLRARGTLIWRLDGFNAAAFVNYVDGYRNTAIMPNVDVREYTTVDLNLAYDFDDDPHAPTALKGTRLAFTVQNLLNEEPPLVLNGTLSFDSQNINPIGRFFAVELTRKW